MIEPCARRSHRPQAAGVIHTDFERGFIRAEVIGSGQNLHPEAVSGQATCSHVCANLALWEVSARILHGFSNVSTVEGSCEIAKGRSDLD